MKTLESFRAEIKKQCRLRNRSNEIHSDLWHASNFVISNNKRFVAYIIKRLYEKYNSYPFHVNYNKVCICDMETGIITKSNFIKFVHAKNSWQDKWIKEIVSVTDKGVIIYVTYDGIVHCFPLEEIKNIDS